MTDTSDPQHPSLRDFDLALLDAPPAPFVQHLATCAACTDRLASLRLAQEAFRGAEEPVRAARIIHARVANRSWRALLVRWSWAPALGVAGVLLALGLLPGPEVRTKGGPRVTVYLSTPAGPRAWDGTPLHADDRVQLELGAEHAARATIFSVDSACAVTREYDVPIEHTRLVPTSWMLRGDEGGERLYAAFASGPITSEELMPALRASGACTSGLAPDLQSPDFVARGVVLRKKVRP